MFALFTQTDRLGSATLRSLDELLQRAALRAVEHGPVLACLTVSADSAADPSAVAWRSRRGHEPLFCFEQPDRAGESVAGLGVASSLHTEGTTRFSELAERWRELASSAVTAAAADDVTPLGPVATGGFAFSDRRGQSTAWREFPNAALHVPELLIARQAGEVRVVCSLLVEADSDLSELASRVQQRLAELDSGSLPLLDPSPAVPARVVSTMPPEHYEDAVASAVSRITSDEFKKIVLSREVQVSAASDHKAGAIFGVLRAAFPSCYVYAVSYGSTTLVGASPELLGRVEGHRASTVALAGSSRRSADPAVDAHLGEGLLRSKKDRYEHVIVVKRIEETLQKHALWVTAAEEPVVIRVANIQHLATPIRAQFADPVTTIQLAGWLHPTPAVGGEPAERTLPVIPALEGLDRGWYSGLVGWTDADGDGEFCVALRCALLDGKVAHCYAGVGVVGDSDPAAELAETELKLQAILPVVAS